MGSGELHKAQGKGHKKIGLNLKLIGIVIPIIVVVMVAIILTIFTSTSRIILAKSEENLEVSTQSVVNSITAWMNEVITSLEIERDALEYFPLDKAAELDYIKHTANQYDAYPAGIYIATTDGALVHASFVPGPEYNVFEKPWYQDGLKSEAFIFGAVYFDEDSQSYVVGASGMLKDKAGKVRGVAAADIYLDAISTIVAEVQLESTGGVFLADRQTGTIIGHRDPAIVGSLLSEQSDPLYEFINQQLSAGTSGLATYRAPGGAQTYLDFAAVPNSQWVAVSYVPRDEIMGDLNALLRTIIAIAIVAIFLLLFLIVLLLWKIIIHPVRKIDAVARHIAEGKLDQAIDYSSNDELGTLAANFNKTVARLRSYVDYIGEISTTLDSIANGNLDFTLTYDYAGEFARVKDALEHISDSLNDTLGQINQSAEEVASGAGQVSDGAQALSQGATEQASAVEELAATISELAEQVHANAGNAVQAREQAESVGHEATDSNERMQRMLTAMREIGATSGEIGKIIKTIEDIAFQTNILALNAAVEAARAGAAGKGFAVVADEVRNLASKSAEASKNTSQLIENSLRATENGIKIANDAAESLKLVVDGVEDVASSIANISRASESQATSISQVNLGVEQISAVVQTNSATAQQSAAASEQLSGQAVTMNNLVGRFHLRGSK